ncbi:hypothetical protein HOY80DRAFT_882511, partial [Tuber brumale]
KRDCKYDGCKCVSSTRPGLYCGYCGVLTNCGSSGGPCSSNVYQCGTGGSCCNYGTRTSCKNFNGPCG